MGERLLFNPVRLPSSSSMILGTFLEEQDVSSEIAGVLSFAEHAVTGTVDLHLWPTTPTLASLAFLDSVVVFHLLLLFLFGLHRPFVGLLIDPWIRRSVIDNFQVYLLAYASSPLVRARLRVVVLSVPNMYKYVVCAQMSFSIYRLVDT